jgi:large conductance mechanosensitive channel
MLKEFKAFLMRGNVVDLAVAVVIGAAFALVVTSLVDNVVTPILGLVGSRDFSDYGITLKHGSGGDPDIVLGWGAVLTAIINFALVAAAIFFLIVKPVNALQARRQRGEEPVDETPAPSDEVILLTEIRDLLRSRGGA